MTKKSRFKIGFLGAGTMAEALIAGLLRSKTLQARDIVATCPSAARLATLRKRYKIKTVSSNAELCRLSCAIMLAVKPKDVASVGADIRALLHSKHLIVSVVAGVTVERLREIFGTKPRLIRSMPNTPAIVGLGATGIYVAPGASAADRRFAKSLFASCGTLEFFDHENQLNAVTGLSGSGPAYVFLMLEALAEAGVENGLSPEAAMALSIQTVLGAAKLAQVSKDSPKELRRKVMSPGGTTVEAIKSLEENLFPLMISKAVQAATKRAEELSRIH